MGIRSCEECKYTKPNIEFYKEQQKEIIIEWERFTQSRKIDTNKVYIDFEAINEIITRIDKRKEYFLYFHDRTKINEFKEVALLVYWINKLRPFTYMEQTPEASHINERFAVFLLMGVCVKFNQSGILKNDGFLKEYIEEIKYSLRYRDLSKEALFLQMDQINVFLLQHSKADC